MKKTELTVRPLSGIDLSGVPEVIRVLPKGHVSSTKGDFEVDDRDIAESSGSSRHAGWTW